MCSHVFFYDDKDVPNAEAFPKTKLPQYPSGTVIFGQSMLLKEFNFSRSGTTAPVIIAHEFAHIIDFKKK